MIKKVHKGQHSDHTVVFVTCLLTSIIQGHVKEGKSLGSDCVGIKDVKDKFCPVLRVAKHKCYLHN